MGVYTQYICDRCTHTQDTPNQMWNIQVVVRAADIPQMASGFASGGEQEMWCRKCVEKLHILPRSDADQKKDPLPPPPTLEQMVRDIVLEELHAQ